MRKIILLDTFSINNFHEIFNFCFLSSLLKGHKTENIEYYADPSVITHLKKHASKENIPLERVFFEFIDINKGKKSWHIFYRHLKGCFFTLRKFFNHKDSRIVVSQLNPYLALLYPLWRKKTNKVFIVCHGELEWLISNPPIYKPEFLYKVCIKVFFKYKFRENLQLIVLGDSIKNNLLNYTNKANVNSIKSIKHPYKFEDANGVKNTQNSGILKIGLIGSASIQKGFGELCSLAVYFKDNIAKGELEFNVIGGNNFDPKDYPLINFRRSVNSSFLSYEDFQKTIQGLDFVLYLYPLNSYKLTASGAFFDAVNHMKPIIALRNDYFKSFEDNFGKIGFLGNSIDDIKNFINHILKAKIIDDYNEISCNLEKIKDEYSFKNTIFTLN